MDKLEKIPVEKLPIIDIRFFWTEIEVESDQDVEFKRGCSTISWT